MLLASFSLVNGASLDNDAATCYAMTHNVVSQFIMTKKIISPSIDLEECLLLE